jgi:hypothetical protein
LEHGARPQVTSFSFATQQNANLRFRAQLKQLRRSLMAMAITAAVLAIAISLNESATSLSLNCGTESEAS